MLVADFGSGDYLGAGLDTVSLLIPGVTNLSGAEKAVKIAAKTNSFKEAADEIHHICTNKSIKSGITAAFEVIFKNAGMDLNDTANLVTMAHNGRHTNKYHQWVRKTLSRACFRLNSSGSSSLDFSPNCWVS
jgi:hypothetical protein